MQSALLDVMLRSKLLSKRAVCGPPRLKAPGLLASPTAPPFPFTIALHCSCAWSCACAQQIHHRKRLDTLTGASELTHMSQRYTDNHLA